MNLTFQSRLIRPYISSLASFRSWSDVCGAKNAPIVVHSIISRPRKIQVYSQKSTARNVHSSREAIPHVTYALANA